jgi:outer membrane protein OmpA-like peptidoglycan-associated protein
MYRIGIFVIILLLCLTGNGQNLIANGSFENENFCEANIPCSPSAWYAVSNIPYGYQNNLAKPIDGKRSLAFLIAYKEEIRSYWQTMLLCDLQKDKKYNLKFYIYSPNTNFDKKYFGVYFSDHLIHSAGDTVLNLNQYIHISEDDIHPYKGEWLEVNLSFIADGNQRYLLLGNFDEASNKQVLKNAEKNIKYIEYYADNISLTTADGMDVKSKAGYKKRLDSLYTSYKRHIVLNKPDNTAVDIITKNMKNIKKDTLILGTINFKFDSYNLTGTKNIKQYFDHIDASEIFKIEITGYTDSMGSDSYNLQLSEKRALSVKAYLVNELHLSKINISATGKGKINDRLPEYNRRVEIVIYKKE